MPIDDLFGIPAHPLLVHFPLILVPLAALTGLLAVAVQRHRRRVAGVGTAIATLALLSTHYAVESGESLEARVPASELLRRHTELGNSARFYVLFLVIALFALSVIPQSSWTAARAQRRRIAVVAASLFVVIASLVSVVGVFRVGYSGAKSVWDQGPERGGNTAP